MKAYILCLALLCIVFYTEAQTNNALDFDGSNDYVQTTFAGITGTADRTFEAWIYLRDTPTSNICITDYGTNSVGNRNTFIINSSLAIGFISGGTNANITSSTNAVSINVWTHVAFVLDNGTGYLYVDALQKGTGNLSNVNTSTGGTNFRIGERITGGAIPFEGIIDEVRVWNVAKTATQIDSLKDEEICSNEPGLVAYYRCNEGTAGSTNTSVTTLIDNSSSGNNGTLNNFSLTGSTSNWVAGTSITSAPHTDSTFIIDTCGFFTTPGGFFFLSNGTRTETITNSQGCDSVLTFNVTIRPTSFLLDTVLACDSFRSPLGTLYTTSSIFNEVFTNRFGCDSTMRTLLVVSSATTETIATSACESYTSPSGKYIWNTSGTYSDTLSSIAGCDSILNINLTVIESTTNSITDTFCDQYTSPTGIVYTASGIYVDTLVNSSNCDSIITQNITINYSEDTLVQATACDSFISYSGQNKIFQTGNFEENFINQDRCDSLVSYQVLINYSTKSSNEITECDFYNTPWGEIVTSSGRYNGLLQNFKGCDSTLTLDIEIIKNTPSVISSNNILSTDFVSDTYQWLDCDDNFSAQPNATESQWNPRKSGSFAVKVEERGCFDTSACIDHTSTLSVKRIDGLKIKVIPSPANGSIKIISDSKIENYVIINSLGQEVKSGKYEDGKLITTSELAPSVYYIRISVDKVVQTHPFIISR